MSSPFLIHFVAGLVERLLSSDALEIRPDSQNEVVHFVAEKLAKKKLKSLVSTLTKSFESCPDVVEFYLDDDTLREMITDLRYL